MVIHQTKRFDVSVGIPPGDDIKHNVYVVTNRTYGVVEFAHNTLHYVREWCSEMENAMDAWEGTGEVGEEEKVVLKAYN
jgi:hypothetical protein